MSKPAAVIEMYAPYRPPVDAPSRSHEELRAMTEQAEAMQPDVVGATVERFDAGGVPIERTRADGVAADVLVVYFHGGGYVCGSASGQRTFLAALAREASAEIWSVEYRLAPEAPHPAAVEDGVAAYRAALERGRPVAVGGDSAGGGLAVAVVVAARDLGLPVPIALFALSPWVDLTLDGATLASHAERDIMVRRNDLVMMRSCYLGDGDPTTATASPVRADLAGLPPLLVQVAGEEILLGDARRLVEEAERVGVAATLDVGEGLFHTWPVLAPDLPESITARASIASFLRVAVA